MSAVWDGTTRVESLKDWANEVRHRLADHAKRYEWDAVFAILAEHPRYVNAWRPGGSSWYAPLHQAAHGGAPLPVVERLLAAGAWRGLRTAEGERPVDIAARRGWTHLLDRLRPQPRLHVPTDQLQAIQRNFHDVIHGRVHELVTRERLRLPELEVLLDLDKPRVWFPVPGMYGGFEFWLETEQDQVRLVTDSWSRVVGGSGQRHVVTADGAQLVKEGFV